MIIAIDGPAASGKGTLGRELAKHFGLAHMDTGKLYRAVGLAVLRAGGDPNDPVAAVKAASALTALHMDDGDITGDEAADAASKVSAIPEVREKLKRVQRIFAASPPGGAAGAVLDGRDIGTIVCPEADIKFFVTAGIEARAERRHKELMIRGEDTIYARVLQDLTDRDTRDSTRSIAPLKLADDAIVLDTTGLDADAVLAVALDHVRSRLGGNTPRPA